MQSKKSKLSSVNRLPSLYVPTLINSESNYQRELRRRLEHIEHENHDIVRRRLTSNHIFTHEHLKTRFQWFNADKSYRDACRVTWSKQVKETNRTNHAFLPNIYDKDNSSTRTNLFQINENDNSMIANEKIVQKFLHTQPVMVEILNAPHSYEAFKDKYNMGLRKNSAQQKHKQIQRNAIDDQRYQRLIGILQES